MNTRLNALLLCAALVILGSCGTSTVGGSDGGSAVIKSEPSGDAPSDDADTTDQTTDTTAGSDMSDDTATDSGSDDAGSDQTSDAGNDGAEPTTGHAEGKVIGVANMGGEIVDPKPHAIDDLLIAESYPEQLQVSFTAGDEPCLAATATALGSEQEVRVVLEVGITTDALTRSCLAGQFPHTLSIALDEGLDGRPVVLDEPTDEETSQAPAEPEPQPFETTLIGLSEQAAMEAAESFGYRWRVLSRDGEDLAGTADYDEQRINAKIVNGTVTETWLG